MVDKTNIGIEELVKRITACIEEDMDSDDILKVANEVLQGTYTFANEDSGEIVTVTPVPRLYKTPSGAEVEIDDDNYITTVVVLDTDALIDNDLEGFIDLLSLGATDTEILSDIDYTLQSATTDGCLMFSVTGNLDLVLDMEDSD